MKKKIGILLCCLTFSIINSKLVFARYTTPAEFMNLYYDFTGNHDKGYPKGKVNASETLMDSMDKSQFTKPGPLILIMESDIFVYEDSGKLLVKFPLRTNPHNGFYEMTSLSHVGPAVAYYLKAKENGSTSWRAGLKTLLQDLKKVQAFNAKKQNNWLDQVDAPSWKRFKPQIHNMVDYGCSLAGSYINGILNDERFKNSDVTFDQTSIINDFYKRSDKKYPVPFNNVMVATFMLTAIETVYEIDQIFKSLNFDWENAKVIIRNKVGTNVTSGLTAGSNWLVPVIQSLSRHKLAPGRIFIAPYASLMPDLGQDPLPKATLSYYRDQIWESTYQRTRVANSVFSFIPNIYVAGRPALPGDFVTTHADQIYDFMIRLKYSLGHATQMLSNTVAFWVAGEYGSIDGDLSKIKIPGLTAGFPENVKGYPANNPKVPG